MLSSWDGLGEWTNEELPCGTPFEWRYRLSRAEDAYHGTKFVWDISVNGGPSQIFADFSADLDQDPMLEYLAETMNRSPGP